MGQNAFGQSDYMIFKSTISLEQNDEKARIFACWYIFIESRSWLKNIGVCIFKNGCGHFVLRTIKLAVCQQKMNEINWFMKDKGYFNNFLVAVVKNGCGLLILGTLKPAVYYKEKLMKWADFLYGDTNLGKLKVTLIIIS